MTIVIKAGRASYFDGRKHHYFTLGQTADVPESVASRWVGRGLAAYVDAPKVSEPDAESEEEIEDVTDDGEPDAYEGMTIAELRNEAKARGVKVPRGSSKADIADLLRADDGRGFDALDPVDAE